MKNKIDYKDTLNLPRTEMPMRAGLPKTEPEIISKWKKLDIYNLLFEFSKDKPKYILHDGPPYANGHIHVGHVFNKVLKDIILKYKIMAGFNCPFIPGWDCHGLPVEHQLFKELKLTKDDISQADFRDKAKEYALRFVNIQKEEFKRLGIFADWDNSYLTLNNNYEAQILKSFSEILKKGFIYKGRKPVNWCSCCETALAEAEVEYKEHTSPSVYVKFKVLSEDKEKFIKESGPSDLKDIKRKDFYFIVWTTTPWTLISNIAIALSPGLKYDFIEVDKEVWVLADSLMPALMDKAKVDNYKKIKELSGIDKLVGIRCKHPFLNRNSFVISAAYVSGEEGTGCVHIAPGHGQEDYEAWLKYKDKFKNFDIIMPVDKKGLFDKTAGEFFGMDILKANEAVIEKLKESVAIIKKEEITHSYPHCWRCRKPIIFRATEQWFMKIDHEGFREKLINEIENKVSWFPAAGKVRISAMIKNRPDWCLSRQRYWGVPIPVFYCAACNEALLDKDIIDFLAQKVKEEGLDIWFKKEAKELLPENTTCPKCSHSIFKKEEDILDVWFDSGISHQAVLREIPELGYPAQLYLEGSDQHRGWFQTSLITALAIEGHAPYEQVLTHGFIVDASGRKMSKSQGNALSPDKVINDLGADILRLWVASSDYHNDISLSSEILTRLTEAYRKIRNTMRFMLGNLYDFEVDRNKVPYEELFKIDRWALDKAKNLELDCLKFYESFQLHKTTQRIYNFCTVEMSSFYLDMLKDRLYTWGKDSLGRRSAQTVLCELLNLLVKLIAPILSFTAEEIWRYLPHNEDNESVFLNYIIPDKDSDRWKSDDISRDYDQLLKIRETVLKSLEVERSKKIIGNSLEAELTLFTDKEEVFKLLNLYKKDLPDIFIVSKVDVRKVGLLPEDALKDKELEHLAVKIARTKALKCPRCWRHVEDITSDEEGKEICLRCVESIK